MTGGANRTDLEIERFFPREGDTSVISAIIKVSYTSFVCFIYSQSEISCFTHGLGQRDLGMISVISRWIIPVILANFDTV